jgi:hypothetical protein
MSSKSRWAVFLVSTPLVVLVAVGGMLGASTEPPQRSDANLAVFRDVLTLVMQNYVEPVDIDKVFEGAMRGLAEGMDSSSAYLTPDEVRALDSTTPMPPADVGLVVTRQFYLRVVGVRDGSPAATAGIQTGDYIRMIDQTPTRDMSAVTGARLLRGAAGSKVAVTVIRGNPADPHVITLVRAVPSGGITADTQPGGFARVRITSFVPDAVTGLKSTFDQLDKQKVAGAVIDLRGTADGDLETGRREAVREERHGRHPGRTQDREGDDNGRRRRRIDHDARRAAGLERHGQRRRGLRRGAVGQQPRGAGRRADGRHRGAPEAGPPARELRPLDDLRALPHRRWRAPDPRARPPADGRRRDARDRVRRGPADDGSAPGAGDRRTEEEGLIATLEGLGFLFHPERLEKETRGLLYWSFVPGESCST